MFARLGRGDAADLDVERAVPGHHADEASRRRNAGNVRRRTANAKNPRVAAEAFF